MGKLAKPAASRINEGTPNFADLEPPDISLLSTTYVENFFGAPQARRLLERAELCAVGGEVPANITRVAFWQLCLDNINLTNDEGHGCTMQPIPKSSWATIFAAVNQMQTVGDGLKRFAELVPIVPAGMTVSVGHSSNGAHLTYDLKVGGKHSARGDRYLEAIALVFHCVLLWLTAETIAPVRLRLSGLLNDGDGSLLSGLTNERTRHGSGLTIVYDRRDLAIPLGVRKHNSWAVPELTTFLEIEANMHRGSIGRPSRTVESLRELLAVSVLSQQQAARAIGMSIATLQRRLAQAGTTFREISRDARREKLLSLLATDGDLDDIAMELGFSDRRSLWRASHEWLGMSPTDYRKGRRVPSIVKLN